MTRSILILALAAGLLGGCQSLLGLGAARFEPRLPPTPHEGTPMGSAAAALAEGRQQLAVGQYGLAISRFREAAVRSENAAAAHNGLGVAYAQLGRADLARRYFLAAIAEAPSEPRYAANLNRLYASTRIEEAQASLPAMPMPPPLPAGIIVETAGARQSAKLVRTSDREVRLVTPSLQWDAQRSAARAGERRRSVPRRRG